MLSYLMTRRNRLVKIWFKPNGLILSTFGSSKSFSAKRKISNVFLASNDNNYSDDESPLSLKVDFLLSFCDIVVGSKDGLQPIEKTVIDRCVRLVYRQYLENPCPENMPILEDRTSFFCNISAAFYGMSV